MFADIEPFLQVTGVTLNGAKFDTNCQNLIAELRPTQKIAMIVKY